MPSIYLKPLFEKQVDPVSALLKDIFKENRFALSYLGALTLGLGVAQSQNLKSDDAIEEVIVTASKKEQNIQDVAMSVQAISSIELDKKNIKGLEDIANLSPAVSFENVGPGKSNFYIRGVSDGSAMNSYAGTNATAALYLDEQPLTSASLTPDLHVYDIERVEILMGPQGTLYGSSSTSGNIKIITKKPDSSSMDYGFDVEYGNIADGSSDKSLEAFINIPIGSNSAARLSTYSVNDGGWIDNLPSSYTYQNYGINYTIDNVTGIYDVAEDDYNDASKEGYRLRFMTTFDNDLSLDLSFLNQESEYNGSYEADILTDDQSQAMPSRSNTRYSPEEYNDDFNQISATLSGSISDNIDFVLTSSIFERDTAYTYDYASYVEYYYYAAYPTYVCDYYDYYYYGNISNCRDPRMTYAQTNDIERTATEIRIQSSNESGFQWILGAFKESNDKTTVVDYLQPGDTYNGGIYWEADLDRQGDVSAVFGEMSYDVSDKTTLTVGFRDYEQDMYLLTSNGSYGTYAYGQIDQVFESSESGTIPKFNISHDVSEDVMLYGTYSEGFRPSGVNRIRPDRRGSLPLTYDADYLESMEIGVKSTSLDGKITFNAAYYSMDWTDYQTTTTDPNSDFSSVAYVDNVGNAEITGFEANIVYAFNSSTELSAYMNSMDPKLVTNYSSGDGLTASAGNRLANMPELTYYLSLDKEFTFFGKPAFLNLDYSYTGDRYDTVDDVSDGSNTRELLPSYSISNLRFGIEGDNSSTELYISNLFDKDGYLTRYDDWGDVGTSGYSGFGVRRTGTKPRVLGIRYKYRF